MHIAAGYMYPFVAARILREGGSADALDNLKKSPHDYAPGLTEWVLSRFQGREPKLDAIVKKHKGSYEDMIPLLRGVKGLNKTVQEMYVSAAYHHDRLGREIVNLMHQLAEEIPEPQRVKLMQRFNIARLIISRSEAPIAVEAMKKDDEDAMHLGLVLLGVKVNTFKYKPDKKLKINGRDALEQVQRAVKAGTTQDGGGPRAFNRAVQVIRDIAEGSHADSDDIEGMFVEDEDDSGKDEL
eukprot:NODE_6730_length_1644_cov_5.154911.p1 GENE.NODE_6730_length_1644_cov_5.154911~~NODE_6730_length_1644_cov_5.154911.p1  ORF type:complete len:240 (+),score=96.80 NODE_6730_length_1644_cov_5.154911:671-1390(+)